jgi:hypothetical protein
MAAGDSQLGAPDSAFRAAPAAPRLKPRARESAHIDVNLET